MISLFATLSLSRHHGHHHFDQNKLTILPKPKVFTEDAPVGIDRFDSSSSDSEYVVENITEIIPMIAEEHSVSEETLYQMAIELEGKQTTGRAFNTLTMAPSEENECARTASLTITEIKFTRDQESDDIIISTKYTHIECRVISQTIKTTKFALGKTKVEYIPRLLSDKEVEKVLIALKEQVQAK